MTAELPEAAASGLDTRAHVTRAARDTRGYWRVLLAVSAPIGWLTVGVANLITPSPLGGTAAENVAAIAADPDRMRTVIAIQPLFLFAFVPGVIALFVACRRAKPLFTAILGTIGILGALAGTFNPPIDLFVVLGLDQGIDQGRLTALSEAVDASGLTWTLLFTFAFISVGRVAAGVLLWQAGVGPRALAVLLAISPAIEFGGQAAGLGNLAPAAAWIASGVAVLGVTTTLLKLPNDAFDVPPLPRGATER